MRYALKLHQEAVRREITELGLKKSHKKLTSAHSELQSSVNKLKSVQNQIMRTEKLAGIGRLAAGVCHEILNPLNIISGHSQALLVERKDDESLVEDLRSIMEEIQRIEKIIGGLLKFSRKGNMDLKAMDINRELDSALSILEKDMNLEGVHVCREFDLELPSIPLDTDRMRQVFFNIINNAKYAMENNGGGTLTVTTEFFNGKNSSGANNGTGKNGNSPLVRIRFSDSGPGIKKEDQQKIFDPFFTTKPEDQGTGLGLSVCHTIIEKHGGSLEVESVENQGATFIIELPLQQEKEEVPV
jgi:signal transduction histidine kinase